jgi:hypothetical protein
MKIVFRTNIDHYKTNCFPENITQAPRVGDLVMVTGVFIEFYHAKKLPLVLEVVEVIWSEKGVLCELYYQDIDIQAAKLSGVNLF